MTIEEMIAQIKGTHNNINGEDLKLLYECLPILEKQANMVEVIRCKDCKHYAVYRREIFNEAYAQFDKQYAEYWHGCMIWGICCDDIDIEPNGYCWKGERKAG